MHEDRAAPRSVIEQALVRGRKIGAKLVGAHTDDDGIELGEVAEGEGLRVEQVDLNAQHAQSVGDGFTFGGDVTDAEVLRHVDGEGVNEALRGLGPEQGGHGGQRFEGKGEPGIFGVGRTVGGGVGVR